MVLFMWKNFRRRFTNESVKTTIMLRFTLRTTSDEISGSLQTDIGMKLMRLYMPMLLISDLRALTI